MSTCSLEIFCQDKKTVGIKHQIHQKILISVKNKISMHKVFDIENILAQLEKDKKGDSSIYFLDFLHNDSFEAGIIRLSPGQKDTQGAHSADELYYVIEGDGFIRILQEDHMVQKGSCIFVPSNTKHYFHGNNKELVVLYVFNVSN